MGYGYKSINNPGMMHPSNIGAASTMDIQGLYEKTNEKAIHKLYSQLRGHTLEDGGHETLIDIFESPELKRLYKQLWDLIKSFKNSKSFCRAILRAHPSVLAAELYLMWKFGIEPIITSINEILATLRNAKVPETTIEARSHGKLVEDIYSEYNGVPDAMELLQSQDYIVTYKYHLQMLSLTELIKSQFGFDTPGASYYASMRLTFVLDWFINIGRTIREYEYYRTQKSWKVINGYKSVLSYNRKMGDVSYHISESEYGTGHAFYKTVSYQRELLSDFPRPPLPHFDVRLKPGKLISLAALLLTNLRIDFRPRKDRSAMYEQNLKNRRLIEHLRRESIRKQNRAKQREHDRKFGHKGQKQLNHNML